MAKHWGIVFFVCLILAATLQLPLRSAVGEEDGGVSLRVGVLPVIEELPLVLAAKEAAMPFKRIKVSPAIFHSAMEIEAALKIGMIDVAGISVVQAARMFSQGVALKVIVLLHRGGTCVVMPAGVSYAGLHDALVGIPGNDSGQLLALAGISERQGLTLGVDVRYITVPLHRATALLRDKRISGFILPEPYGQIALSEGVVKEVFTLKEYYPDMIDLVAVVRQEFIEKEPTAIQELIQGITSAGRFIEEDRQKTGGRQVALHQKDILGFDTEIFARALGSDVSIIRFDQLEIDEAVMAISLKRAFGLGILDTAVNVRDLVANNIQGEENIHGAKER